jgi:hypothetical protein
MTVDKDLIALLGFLALCAVLAASGEDRDEGVDAVICGFEATGGEEDE